MEFIDQLLQLENLIFIEIESKQYVLEKYPPTQPLGAGSNSEVYEIEGYPDLVLKIYGQKWGTGREKVSFEYAKRDFALHQTVPKEVQFGRAIEFGVWNGKIILIMKRAYGKPVHTKEEEFDQWSHQLEILSQVPQSQYNKLTQDVRTLAQYGLSIDPSKPDNFFYDPHRGFTIIDVNPGNSIHSLTVPLIYTYQLFRSKEHITINHAQFINEILYKLKEAGDASPGHVFEQIMGCIRPLLSS